MIQPLPAFVCFSVLRHQFNPLCTLSYLPMPLTFLAFAGPSPRLPAFLPFSITLICCEQLKTLVDICHVIGVIFENSDCVLLPGKELDLTFDHEGVAVLVVGHSRACSMCQAGVSVITLPSQKFVTYDKQHAEQPMVYEHIKFVHVVFMVLFCMCMFSKQLDKSYDRLIWISDTQISFEIYATFTLTITSKQPSIRPNNCVTWVCNSQVHDPFHNGRVEIRQAVKPSLFTRHTHG